MTFEKLWVLNFLWSLPLLVFLQIVAKRRRRKHLAAFADQDLLPRLGPVELKSRTIVRGAFVVLAVGLMIFSMAGPQWGEHFQEVVQKGVDIIVCVDVSASMLVEDAKPNRLERAKREVADLINVVGGDRLGLAAFSGAAFLQCPLTLDYQALLMFLSQLNPDLIPVPGTDLGSAIDVAMAAFDEKTATDKVILLLTDGEDNEETGLNAAEKASDANIKVFVFGIGDPAGGPVPIAQGGGFEKDGQGRMVLSKLDEDNLRRIAQTTGGGYVRSVDGDFDLDRLYFEGIRKKTSAQVVKTGKITIREQRFFIFLLAAWMLLFIEGVLREKNLDINNLSYFVGHARMVRPGR